MKPKSRRQKIASSEHHDRISRIPDVIIGEILLLIPTTEAVATSILSKRWQYLWTLKKNLDFDCNKEHNKKDPTAFGKFVDRVLSKCTIQELHKFNLCTYCCKSYLTRWVNEPNIRKLKVLHFSFPSHLIGLVQKLVSGSPALEDFSMRANSGFQETFVISLPLLKRLEMDTTSCDSGENEYKLVIDAPQLQYLEIRTGSLLPSYVIQNVASIVDAVICVGGIGNDVTEKETHCIVELLNQLIEVKSLTLDSLTLRGLYNAEPEMLPIFNKMTLLKLRLGIFCGWEVISFLLQASPSLEVFIVEMDDELDELETIEYLEFDSIVPQHVPPCLSSCLRIVKIDWLFQGENTKELEMMKYLLDNGEVLQKFVVKASSVYNDVEFLKKLLTFPRASRYCEVEVKRT